MVGRPENEARQIIATLLLVVYTLIDVFKWRLQTVCSIHSCREHFSCSSGLTTEITGWMDVSDYRWWMIFLLRGVSHPTLHSQTLWLTSVGTILAELNSASGLHAQRTSMAQTALHSAYQWTLYRDTTLVTRMVRLSAMQGTQTPQQTAWNAYQQRDAVSLH